MAGKHVFKGNRVYILVGLHGKRELRWLGNNYRCVGSDCGLLQPPSPPGEHLEELRERLELLRGVL